MIKTTRLRSMPAIFALCVAAAAAHGGASEDISPISDTAKLPVGKVSETWLHASETSAVIYWQTENRAGSFVEYGPTRACKQKTPAAAVSSVTRLPHWTQLHRITGLAPGKRCYYRRVCVGTDGKTVRGDVEMFQTPARRTDVIRIPDDLPAGAYVLDRKGATYVLTKDLTMPSGGLEIRADRVTLDMDGHTLVYNDKPATGPAEWSKRAYRSQPHDFGINVTARGSVRIVNGRIEQGRGASAGTPVGIGCNPLYARSGAVEMAGVEVVWSGRDVSGLFLHWGQGSYVHHCVFDDRGSKITNRHQAISTVDGSAGGRYEHNLVKRTRQQGLVGAAKATHNEVYVDSCATNAFGITGSAKSPAPVEIAHNRIIGIGEHPVGIGMFKVFKPGTAVHHNLVEVKCTRSGAEYGYTGSACFRTTWGADNLHVHDNTFIGHADVCAGKVAKTRVIWVGLPKFTPKGAAGPIGDARGLFANNYVAALGRKGAKAGGICVVCLNDSPNLIFHGNTVVSTWGNVLLGDSYGHAGGYPKFVSNIFRRAGKHKDYWTVRHEYAGRPATGVFLANECEQGADANSIRLQAGGEVVTQQMVEIAVKGAKGAPVGGARVVIRDKAGRVVFQDVTPVADAEAMLCSSGAALAVHRPVDRDARGYVAAVPLTKGSVCAVLTEHVRGPEGKQPPQAYVLTATKAGGGSASRTLGRPIPGRIELVLKAGGDGR